MSRYVWRGIPYSDGATLHPLMWVAGHDFTATVWSNFVVADARNRGTFDQIFVTAAWQRDLGRGRVEPKLQSCSRGEGAGNARTVEAVARAPAAVGSFRIFADHTIDIAASAGDYVGDAGVMRTIAVTPRTELTVAGWASPSFNRDHIGVDRNAIRYVALETACTIRLGPA